MHPEDVGDDPTAADASRSPEEAAAESRIRPDWFHREHPVFLPLAGFFTGMLYIILIPGSYAAVLKALVGYQRAEQLFPFVLLTLIVPIGLVVPHRTRKFGKFMLLGVVSTVVVVAGVGLGVLWFLLNRDG
ncbi:hypothetical protein GCM10022242_06290 [Nocardioides panacisoli]|uniref:Uncharacterized protein n=1 Tax=Nocardioides panacisoli TaxID=627624 RepID=A0ABP7I111_9ACTN